jgi:hypothetical protein
MPAMEFARFMKHIIPVDTCLDECGILIVCHVADPVFAFCALIFGDAHCSLVGWGEPSENVADPVLPIRKVIVVRERYCGFVQVELCLEVSKGIRAKLDSRTVTKELMVCEMEHGAS